MTVTLSWTEVMTAAQVGVMRQVQNLREGRRHRFGAKDEDGWGMHIEGAAGELVVAKALGLYWPGVGRLRAADVGELQVRTRSLPTYDLIVHPDDDDDAPCVLVTGRVPTFEVRGWLLGKDAKQPRYWKDPAGGRPAFFVPQPALHPMDALRGIVALALDVEED